MNFAQSGPVNRVAEAISLYALQEAQFIASNPVGWKQDGSGLDLKIRFYEGIAGAAYPNATKPERNALQFVRHQIRRMEAAKHPTRWRRIFYHPAAVFLRDVVLQRRQGFRLLDDRIRQTMRNEVRTLNQHALQQSLNDRGFRLPVESVLRKMMAQEMPHFHFRYADPLRCKNTEFVLHFAKVPGSDFYCFQSFDAVVRPDLQTMLNRTSPTVQHSFDMISGKSFSAVEAAALVNGDSVAHIVEGREKWYTLETENDFSGGQASVVIHPFDLEAELKKIPLKPLSGTQYTNLLRAMREGQSRSVDLQVDGKHLRCKIQAAPKNRSIIAYDEHGRHLNIGNMSKQKKAEKPEMTSGLRVLEDLENSMGINKKQKRASRKLPNKFRS